MKTNLTHKALVAAETFSEVEVPTLQPTDREVLVKIKAVSVNPVDFKVRPSRQGKILGWDASGLIVAIGDQVRNFKIGDSVYYAGDITKSGSNSEFQLVDERLIGHKPKTLDDAEAAALPLTSLTAWESLFNRLEIDKIHSEKFVLIVGAAGGVGSMAIQMIKALTKHKVIATASRKESEDWCRSLGADFVINHNHDFTEELKKINLSTVDYIFSTTHSDQYQNEFPKIIKPQGKLCLIDDPKTFDIVPFKMKSISVHWELMFTRSLFNTDDLEEQHKILEKVSELVDNGKLRTTSKIVLEGFNSENFEKAHELLQSGSTIGKISIKF